MSLTRKEVTTRFISKKKLEKEVARARDEAFREVEGRVEANRRDEHLNTVLRDINRRLLILESRTSEKVARPSNEVSVTTDVGYWV